MLHTHFLPLATCFWSDLTTRRTWPLVLGLLLATVAYAPSARAADPPLSVDEFRAAFDKDLDHIKLLSEALGIDQALKIEKQREVDMALQVDKKRRQDELNALTAKIADEEQTLKTTLDARGERVDKLIDDEMAKADKYEQVALAYLIGEEARQVRFPPWAHGDYVGSRGQHVIAEMVEKLHPEVKALTALTEAARPGQPARPIEVRQAAAVALGKCFGPPKVVVPALSKMLLTKDNPPALRLTAASALDKPIQLLQNPPESKKDNKNTPNSRLANQEREALASEGLSLVLRDTGGLALAAFIGGLKDDAVEVRLACIHGCKDITHALLAKVPLPPYNPPDDPKIYKENQRRALAETRYFLTDKEYGKLLRECRDQMPKLLVALDDPDPDVRLQTLAVLDDLATTRRNIADRLGLAGAVELPLPKEGAESGGEQNVGAAVLAAGKLTLIAAEAPPEPNQDLLPSALASALRSVAKALKDPDVRVRRKAATMLEIVGENASDVLPALVDGLSDKDRYVRWPLLRALSRLAPREPKLVVPKVAAQLQAGDIDLRLAAIATCERYGKDAGAAVSGLTALLPWDDVEVKLAAMKALQAIGPDAAPAVPTIADLLKNPNASVRIAAAETLGQFGKNAAQSRPALERALNDPDDDVREAIGEALLRLRT